MDNVRLTMRSNWSDCYIIIFRKEDENGSQ